MFRVFTTVFAFFICSGFAFSQMFLDTIWYDAHWKQLKTKEDGYYYRLLWADTSGTLQFFVKDFYPDGILQMEGTYRSINPDIKEGLFTYYYPNGKIKMECNFSKGLIDGIVSEWYENGHKKSETGYKNQLLDGTYKSWKADGIPSLEMHYKQGELHGLFISYYSDGSRVREDFYQEGELKRKKCFSRTGKDTTWFPYVEMPEFPGGGDKFNDFLDKSIMYPAEALANRIQGKVEVTFTVNPEGKIMKVTIARSDNKELNNEALRVISSSPDWRPGKKDGQPAEITITVPVWFRIKK